MFETVLSKPYIQPFSKCFLDGERKREGERTAMLLGVPEHQGALGLLSNQSCHNRTACCRDAAARAAQTTDVNCRLERHCLGFRNCPRDKVPTLSQTSRNNPDSEPPPSTKELSVSRTAPVSFGWEVFTTKPTYSSCSTCRTCVHASSLGFLSQVCSF